MYAAKFSERRRMLSHFGYTRFTPFSRMKDNNKLRISADSTDTPNTSLSGMSAYLTKESSTSPPLSSMSASLTPCCLSTATMSLSRCLLPASSPTNWRPRTRSSTTIWTLPEELLIKVCHLLHIKDLLSLIQVHPAFSEIVSESRAIWSRVSFSDVWPTAHHLSHFKKAADNGNIEALIKLGVAYLYNEGLTIEVESDSSNSTFDGRRMTANGEKAAELFCDVELLLGRSVGQSEFSVDVISSPAPFTWLFIRPPWASSGACCKECVFNKMVSFAKQHKAPAVNICIARTLELLDPEVHIDEIKSQLNSAANHGSALAQFLLWERQYGTRISGARLEKGEELRAIRALREISATGDSSAQLTLCRLYATGRYGGYTRQQAAQFIRDFMSRSAVVDVRTIYSRSSELTPSMRYILIDWMVEVAHMKGFDSLTLHVSISVVDSFLLRRLISRSKLQLLGVSAMVLCSRFLGRDIITIREAAWLTDNTYKYEDVVRMMGEISAALRGNFRVLNSMDYTILLGQIVNNGTRCQHLSAYLCELSLLHAELSCYSQASIAASCVLLARLTLSEEVPWSLSTVSLTGFSLQSLAPTLLHIHRKCFMEAAMTDHRDVILQAVTQRYRADAFQSVSAIKVLSTNQLNTLLGLVPVPSTPTRALHSLAAASSASKSSADSMNLIASPSRSGRDRSMERCYTEALGLERCQAATPTPEEKHVSSDWSLSQQAESSTAVLLSSMDTSFHDYTLSSSGYEADREDDEEMEEGGIIFFEGVESWVEVEAYEVGVQDHKLNLSLSPVSLSQADIRKMAEIKEEKIADYEIDSEVGVYSTYLPTYPEAIGSAADRVMKIDLNCKISTDTLSNHMSDILLSTSVDSFVSELKTGSSSKDNVAVKVDLSQNSFREMASRRTFLRDRDIGVTSSDDQLIGQSVGQSICKSINGLNESCGSNSRGNNTGCIGGAGISMSSSSGTNNSASCISKSTDRKSINGESSCSSNLNENSSCTINGNSSGNTRSSNTFDEYGGENNYSKISTDVRFDEEKPVSHDHSCRIEHLETEIRSTTRPSDQDFREFFIEKYELCDLPRTDAVECCCSSPMPGAASEELVRESREEEVSIGCVWRELESQRRKPFCAEEPDCVNVDVPALEPLCRSRTGSFTGSLPNLDCINSDVTSDDDDNDDDDVRRVGVSSVELSGGGMGGWKRRGATLQGKETKSRRSVL